MEYKYTLILIPQNCIYLNIIQKLFHLPFESCWFTLSPHTKLIMFCIDPFLKTEHYEMGSSYIQVNAVINAPALEAIPSHY
jgi:hypothetical protein